MKVEEVKGIMCPECNDFIEEDDIPKVGVYYQCGECEAVDEDKEEAKECCKE